jgi:hypothetical protein
MILTYRLVAAMAQVHLACLEVLVADGTRRLENVVYHALKLLSLSHHSGLPILKPRAVSISIADPEPDQATGKAREQDCS